jgi:hypothetical protein
MRGLYIIFSFICLTVDLLYCQDLPKYDIKDFPCFSSVMIFGTKAGYWDTSLIKPDTSDCIEYFNKRIFKVIYDTLIIIQKEDTLIKDFVGVKCVIESDSVVFGYLYIYPDIKLTRKGARLKKKEPHTDNHNPLKFYINVHGDFCRIGLGQDNSKK